MTARTDLDSMPAGVDLRATASDAAREILTPDALALVARLHREFDTTRLSLLQERKRRQAALDAGDRPDFPSATKSIRESAWRVAPIPDDLLDRRVEITGPTERKMVINALNSGARTFMADLEDASSPTFENMVEGQRNLRDANLGVISFVSEEGKAYRLGDRIATLLVRPRGWHLPEKHLQVDGRAVSGGIFDFALYLYHNARRRLEDGSGPYFYLPKLENHAEARLWNDIFELAQDDLGIPRGSIRATVLIENILATFEADEILWELKDHAGGLNCGRWDYIFSYIKKFRADPGAVMPDRSQVTMVAPMMQAYARHVVKVCHRRGIHAIGGMAAQIPIRHDPAANERAMAKVHEDKVREVGEGHDGTWVAHPGLVPMVTEVFDEGMPGPNQIDRQRDDVDVQAADLLRVPEGTITDVGVRTNVNVGVAYLESWLRGSGCVPLYNLMEDAATCEISRAQLWQWARHGAKTDDGRTITHAYLRDVVGEELARWRSAVGEDAYAGSQFGKAAALFQRITEDREMVEFLTLPAYELLP